jgi:hypothetical protein
LDDSYVVGDTIGVISYLSSSGAPVDGATVNGKLLQQGDPPIVFSLDPTAAGQYQGTVSAALPCGVYTVVVEATGDYLGIPFARSASTVIAISVPGNTALDPCSSDSDGDGLTDEAELLVHDTSPAHPDTDGDGCSDGAELGTNENLGGQRDPLNSWDFFEVTGDGGIDIGDALMILTAFGLGPSDSAYDARFDRYAPDDGAPWRTDASLGTEGIDLADVLLNLASFGHGCASP